MKIKFVKKAATSPDTYQYLFDDLVPKFMKPSAAGERPRSEGEARFAVTQLVIKELLNTLVGTIRHLDSELSESPVVPDAGVGDTNPPDATFDLQDKIDRARTSLKIMMDHINAAKQATVSGIGKDYNFSLPSSFRD